MKNLIVRIEFDHSKESGLGGNPDLPRQQHQSLAVSLEKYGKQIGGNPSKQETDFFLISQVDFVQALSESPKLNPETTIHVYTLASPEEQFFEVDSDKASDPDSYLLPRSERE